MKVSLELAVVLLVLAICLAISVVILVQQLWPVLTVGIVGYLIYTYKKDKREERKSWHHR